MKKRRIRLFLNYLRAINQPDSVFIWIPKSAGTSIYQVLARHGCQRLKRADLVKDCFPNKGIVTFVHQDYAKLVEAGYVSTTFDQKSFKYCFSRNPYSRAVSLFFYMKKEKRIPSELTFLEFCQLISVAEVPDIGLKNVSGITHVDSYSVVGLSMCRPQARWIENVDIDYIGRLETIAHDLNQVLSRLGLSQLKSLPKKNTTKHDSFRKYYCQESKLIVEDFYSQDFETFEYKIEDWPLETFQSAQTSPSSEQTQLTIGS